jgi:protein kinase C substrate 80K-H
MMRAAPLLRLLAACLTAAAAVGGDSSPIRGMPPEMAAMYVPDADGLFRCIIGATRISFSRLNDDYCDCPDGSDEPGERGTR